MQISYYAFSYAINYLEESDVKFCKNISGKIFQRKGLAKYKILSETNILITDTGEK